MQSSYAGGQGQGRRGGACEEIPGLYEKRGFKGHAGCAPCPEVTSFAVGLSLLIYHQYTDGASRQLLNDCGIGGTPSEDGDAAKAGDESDSITSQHRVLIFCQMRQMLDIIEEDLFRVLMPSVTYMRLDGSTPANQRHGVVQTFNSDPSIDCLLLTTSVGGLGLTLTGADTVIFVEHDWNPMKDLQAMDRAHRLGQKKVVNVYRLITKGTLEEKIMGYV